MTRDETKKIVAVIATTYSNFHPSDLSLLVDVWTSALMEYAYAEVSAALAAYIRTETSGFAPSPGQLIDLIAKARHADELTETAAWALVRRAIGRSAYHAEEEFEALPDAVRDAVGAPSQLWAWAVDEDFNEGVISSNFMRSYRVTKQRRIEDEKIPERVRLLLAGKVEEARALTEKEDDDGVSHKPGS